MCQRGGLLGAVPSYKPETFLRVTKFMTKFIANKIESRIIIFFMFSPLVFK